MKKWIIVAIGVVAVMLISATIAGAWNWTSKPDVAPTTAGSGDVRVPPTEEPSDPFHPPVSIIDNMNPNECSMIHNINACFVSGRPPADIPIGDYVGPFMLAQQDLMQRFGLAFGSIKLSKIERVVWNDTSLGNPQPGMMYAQVLTPGFKMTLESKGKSYLYHTSMEQVVFVSPA